MTKAVLQDQKLPISAIVVGLNEAHYLKNVFPKLSFCDEILYFDLGSTDNSKIIAEQYHAKITDHERVDSCEWIHEKFAEKTKHEWVLITDPDELLSDELIANIFDLFNHNKIEETTGAIFAPWQFYFKNKKLKGTTWGGINRRILLANNKRFQFSGLIHVGRKVRAGFNVQEIAFKQENFIHHYWMTGYIKLFEKHIRYLKNEGKARYNTGRTATIKNILSEPYRAFRYSYFIKQGHKDGLTGLFLSLFWSWYETSAQWKNYRYEKLVKAQNNLKSRAV